MLRKAFITLGLCFSLSNAALAAAPRSIIDAGDITDDPIVARDLTSGKAVKIEMNLSVYFDELANTTKGMRIDGDGLAGIKPSCKELRTKMGLTYKATCHAAVNNKDIEIGSDGEPNRTCTSRQVPYQEKTEVCQDVCHGGEDSDGNCAEPDRICHDKIVTKHRTVTSCQDQDYDIYFDTTGNSTVDYNTLRTHVEVNKLVRNTDGKADVLENYSGKRYDVDSTTFLLLKCEDGTAIGKSFTDFKTEQRFTYKQIHQACPKKKVYLQSNRALFFDAGSLNFYFDGY